MTEDIKHNHILVPVHEKISDEEKKELFEKFHITDRELPKILLNDPAIQSLGVKVGDVIKITRKSPTAGTAIYYRGVTND